MSDPWGLEGATVAITGASTGIGAALTDAFLDSGRDRPGHQPLSATSTPQHRRTTEPTPQIYRSGPRPRP